MVKAEINKVLLIDDNEIDLFLCKKLMELYEFSNQVVVKKSCKEALNYMSQVSDNIEELPDFIFLDLFMPVQNGYDFLKIYSEKSLAIKSKCKVIVLSVIINEDEVQKLAKNKDVYTLLQKPLSKEALSGLTELHSLYDNAIHREIVKQ